MSPVAATTAHLSSRLPVARWPNSRSVCCLTVEDYVDFIFTNTARAFCGSFFWGGGGITAGLGDERFHLGREMGLRFLSSSQRSVEVSPALLQLWIVNTASSFNCFRIRCWKETIIRTVKEGFQNYKDVIYFPYIIKLTELYFTSTSLCVLCD